MTARSRPCWNTGGDGGYNHKSHPGKRKTSGQKVPRSLFQIRFLFGLAQLGRLLGLPVIQQRNDHVFHFSRGLVLAEILFQFRAIDDHLVYLLFLLRQNPVDHIAVELAVLVQLPHFLCLRQRGRGLLPLDGHSDIPLIFGADE